VTHTNNLHFLAMALDVGHRVQIIGTKRFSGVTGTIDKIPWDFTFLIVKLDVNGAGADETFLFQCDFHEVQPCTSEVVQSIAHSSPDVAWLRRPRKHNNIVSFLDDD
jgi:hypothetical protein